MGPLTHIIKCRASIIVGITAPAACTTRTSTTSRTSPVTTITRGEVAAAIVVAVLVNNYK